MKNKTLLSVFTIILGTMSMITSVAAYSINDLDGLNTIDKLALIMAADGQELIAKAMAPSIKCTEGPNWSQDLTLSRLNDMITIFMGNMGDDYVPPRTYIFVPQCPKLRTFGHVYISGSGNHAEDSMLGECGHPNEFYLTSSPCPNCAMKLFSEYEHSTQKPTIIIARPYTGKGKTGKGNKNVNLICLAMLVQAGFQLVPWHWGHFQSQYITNAECNNAIARIISSPQHISQFVKRFDETKGALDKVMNMVTEATQRGISYYNECNNALHS